MAIEFESGQRNRRVGERSHAFLLRCWLEPDGSLEGGAAWRFSLTYINAKRVKKGFANLDGLVAYLQNLLERSD
jgi:hypothetical protein